MSYTPTMTTLSCVHCGESFRRNFVKGKTPSFCSTSCQAKARRARPHQCRSSGCSVVVSGVDLCSLHARKAWLLFRYGITMEEFAALLASQGGCCRICGCSSPRGLRRDWQVDHDHIEGYDTMSPEEKRAHVRGVLCFPCNSSLGLLEDSPDRLRSALAYLEAGARPFMRGSP